MSPCSTWAHRSCWPRYACRQADDGIDLFLWGGGIPLTSEDVIRVQSDTMRWLDLLIIN